MFANSAIVHEVCSPYYQSLGQQTPDVLGNLTILDFPHSVELAFSSPLFLFMCAFVLQLSC